MMRNTIFLNVLLACSSLNAVHIKLFPSPEQITLRNGTQVHKDRLEIVWKAIVTLYKSDRLEYFWLWRASKKCQELNQSNLYSLYKNAREHFLYPLKSTTLDFLEKNGVINNNGDLDISARNIILSSYWGSSDSKIVDIRYPVSAWGKITSVLKQLILKDALRLI